MRSPVEYYFRYQDLTIPASDGGEDLATGVMVDRYRLGAQQPYIDERIRLARKVQNDLKIRRKSDPAAKIQVRAHTPGGYEVREFDGLAFTAKDQLWALLRYPYVGKGSPEAVQAALQLGAVDLPGSPAIVEPANFQSYCDKWFGLDCNGFVGNYLRHEYRGLPWWDVNASPGIGPDHLITDIWSNFDGVARKRADEIASDELNLLAMVDASGAIIKGGGAPYGHIMLSGPGESAEVFNLKAKLGVPDDKPVPAICIAESTGAIDPADHKTGLVRSFYAYADRAGQPGVIRVNRGFNGSVINVRVKGAPWPG
jgi:hypothetical protein